MWLRATCQSLNKCNEYTSTSSDMKTVNCADTSSQLSESFIQDLQHLGVTANNLAHRKKSASAIARQHTMQNLTPEFYYTPNEEGDTQLHLSIVLEKFDISDLLINMAPNSSYLDIANDEFFTALHYAALSGQYAIVRKLILAGANTRLRTKQGDTALHLAVREGHVQCIKALSDPLNSAEKICLAKSNIPRQMPQLPVEIDARNYIGQTALHCAANKNDVQLVHEMLLAGADVNAKEGLSGKTALHMAIEKDNAEVVRYLVQIPTTLSATTYSGDGAYEIAVDCRPHYAEYLLQYGAVPIIRTHDDEHMSEDNSNNIPAYAYTNVAKLVTV